MEAGGVELAGGEVDELWREKWWEKKTRSSKSRRMRGGRGGGEGEGGGETIESALVLA